MTLGVQEAKRKQKQDGRARIFFRNKVGKLKTPRWGWVWHALWVFKFGLKIYWSGQKWEHSGNFASAQLLSHVQLFVTPWTAARQASLSFTNSRSLLKLMSIQLVMPSNHLLLCLPLLHLSSIFPSIGVFSKELALHIKWPKYGSFSFSNSPSNEYSGLISFRIDWFDLFAFQGTLKSLLQHHSSKASILQCSAFIIVQLSHPYMTTGKNSLD